MESSLHDALPDLRRREDEDEEEAARTMRMNIKEEKKNPEETILRYLEFVDNYTNVCLSVILFLLHIENPLI